MRRAVVVVVAPGVVVVEHEELPPLADGQLLLETVATGVSAGTELAFVKGDHVEAGARYDRELGLFGPTPGTQDDGGAGAGSLYPVRRLGYMEVARVTRSRAQAIPTGQIVAAAYGHASAHVADPVREHLVALPDDLDPLLGVFVAHLGPICANALLHAAAQVCPVPHRLDVGVGGRRVAVIGGGTVGLLTGLLCDLLGAAETVVVDEDQGRRDTATALGLLSWDPGPADDPAANIASAAALKARWRHHPADHGADVVFQCRGRSRALATALRIVRPQGVVVDLAFYTEPAAAVHLGAEFHHNGLTIVSAQIGRTPRGTGPWWDRHRLSRETIALLRERGTDIRQHLLTDVRPLIEAPAALTEAATVRRTSVGLVFTCTPP